MRGMKFHNTDRERCRSLRFFLLLNNSVQKPMLEETRSPSESHGGQISKSILSMVVV